MEDNKHQSVSFDTIVKIIYKNISFIIIVTVITTVLAALFAFTNKSYKTEINLYGNDKVLTEIGEDSQYSLNSFDFYLFLKDHSKVLSYAKLPEEKYLEKISNDLVAQSEKDDPKIKVKFTTNNEVEGENFAKEYVELSQKYFLNKKNTFLDAQLKLLQQQYDFLSKNVDIRTTKDALSDTLVSRLAYYRLLKNDSTPVVKYINSITKPAINKKIVLVAAIFLGFLLGTFIAFVKEFSKTLDWKNIKSKN